MRTVLVDVRCWQGDADAAAETLLGAARVALPCAALIALIDPALPGLPDRVAGLFDRVRQTAGVRQAEPPACLVQLSPLHDPLFVAALLTDPAIASVTVELPQAPPPSTPAARIDHAIARYWHTRYDRVVPPAALWATVAGLPDRAPASPPDRPCVALLDPAPDEALATALRALVDLHLFTGPDSIGALPFLSGRFDRVVGVVANTARHARIAALLERYGGACVLLDAGLPALHRGEAATAEAELGRRLGPDELANWEAGGLRPAASFLGGLARSADTLIVPSAAMAGLLERRFGRRSTVVARPVRPQPRRAGEGRFLIGASVASGLGVNCLWALDLLRSWGVAAHLHLGGPAGLPDLCTELDLTDQVTLAPTVTWQSADLFLALAVGPATRPSADLQAAAAHGLPCVASETVSMAVEAAPWITPMPDEPSPVLLAEAILAARAAAPDADAVQAYAARHAPEMAAAQLCAALGL